MKTIDKIGTKNKKQIDKLTAKRKELKSRKDKLNQRLEDLKPVCKELGVKGAKKMKT